MLSDLSAGLPFSQVLSQPRALFPTLSLLALDSSCSFSPSMLFTDASSQTMMTRKWNTRKRESTCHQSTTDSIQSQLPKDIKTTWTTSKISTSVWKTFLRKNNKKWPKCLSIRAKEVHRGFHKWDQELEVEDLLDLEEVLEATASSDHHNNLSWIQWCSANKWCPTGSTDHHQSRCQWDHKWEDQVDQDLCQTQDQTWIWDQAQDLSNSSKCQSNKCLSSQDLSLQWCNKDLKGLDSKPNNLNHLVSDSLSSHLDLVSHNSLSVWEEEWEWEDQALDLEDDQSLHDFLINIHQFYTTFTETNNWEMTFKANYK